MSNKQIVKQVWLNIQTGEFSNSWTKEINPYLSTEKLLEVMEKSPEKYSPWKLIEYICLSDENFEFSNLMKIR